MAKGKVLSLDIGAKFEDEDFSIKKKPQKTTSKSTSLLLPEKHQLVFKREKRRGKPITLVGEFSLTKENLINLSKKLKKKLGVGGTISENWLEFQGELQDKLRELLKEESFKFKRC